MLRIFTLLLFAVLAIPTNVHAAAPKLTLLFSGNTEAEVLACPS
ncbi:MAG: hypothetical protein AB9900_10345 [Humidesulfovibrio sp.]